MPLNIQCFNLVVCLHTIFSMGRLHFGINIEAVHAACYNFWHCFFLELFLKLKNNYSAPKRVFISLFDITDIIIILNHLSSTV